MLTIITPTLNAAETLQRCIDSVRRQGVEVEHLFVDGGSTDGTREMLVDFIDAPGSNIYEAQNIGIQAAKGEWLYFLGADDYLADDALAQLYPVLNKYESRWFRGRIQVEGRKYFRAGNRQQCFVYHASLYDDYGLYTTTDLGGDARFNDMLRASGEPIEMLDIDLAYFSLDGVRRRANGRT